MAIQVINSIGIQAALGQFVTIKGYFSSSNMLSGKVLKLWPELYDTSIIPTGTPNFQVVYPASPGLYEFINLNWKNYKAKLKVVDSKTFEIHLSFFVTDQNGYLNASGDLNFTAALNIEINGESATSLIPIDSSQLCDGVEFIESGFIPNEDLNIQIKIDGSVDNNCFIGWIKSDSINLNGPIIPGLISNYGLLSNGINAVDALPNNCFKDGNGFIESNGESIAFVTVDGSCLQSNSSYQLYICYFQNGKWQFCISNEIQQAADYKSIIPNYTAFVVDEFGNTGQGCVSGLSLNIPIDIILEIDQADYELQLNETGLSGNFGDYYKGSKVFLSSNPSLVNGNQVTYDESTSGLISIEDFVYSKEGIVYIIIQVEFDYTSHSDFINIPIELNYDAIFIEDSNPVLQNGLEVLELCDGETYELTNSLNSSCISLQSINGSNYTENSIINGSSIKLEEIPIDGIVCIKKICSNGTTGTECICPECEEIQLEVIADYDEYTNDFVIYFTALKEGSIITINGYTSNNNKFEFGGVGSHGYSYTAIVEKDGCVWNHLGFVSGGVSTSYLETMAGAGNYTDCDCEEEEDSTPEDCNNYASISYDCNEETGEITLSVNENFDSPVASSDFLCSTDGGVTFIPCPSLISGEQIVFVKYDAIFSDGCSPIHIEQNISCKEGKECVNTRGIILTSIMDKLNINIDDQFQSNVLTDILKVSLDGGLTFDEFNPSSSYAQIDLEGTEQVVVTTEVIFEDGCSDIHTIDALDLTEIPDNGIECEGYDSYSVDINYNEETQTFEVVKNGNESVLIVNEIKWTLGGHNPFDSNGSGIPYTSPVIGEGLFIARWRIKLKGCEEVIIDKVSWGKSCLSLCEPIDVNVPVIDVNFPSTPIEVCVVDCSDFDFIITCNDCELGITTNDDLSTCSFEWKDPNGVSISSTEVATPTIEGNYSLSVSCAGTTKVKTYYYDKAEAGTPVSNPINI